MTVGVRHLVGLHRPHDRTFVREPNRERANQVMAQLTVPFSGVPDILTALRDNQLKIGIVSSKFRYRIVDILTRATSSHLSMSLSAVRM